jgi:hypothetical protein
MMMVANCVLFVWTVLQVTPACCGTYVRCVHSYQLMLVTYCSVHVVYSTQS